MELLTTTVLDPCNLSVYKNCLRGIADEIRVLDPCNLSVYKNRLVFLLTKMGTNSFLLRCFYYTKSIKKVNQMLTANFYKKRDRMSMNVQVQTRSVSQSLLSVYLFCKQKSNKFFNIKTPLQKLVVFLLSNVICFLLHIFQLSNC